MVGAESKHMQLLAHNDLNGRGNGGEGMALQQTADGRRILYIAHERAPTFLSMVDVSDPHKPQVVRQLTNEDAVGDIEAWLKGKGEKSLQERPSLLMSISAPILWPWWATPFSSPSRTRLGVPA